MTVHMQFEYGVDGDSEPFIAFKADQLQSLINQLNELGYGDNEPSVILLKDMLKKVNAIEVSGSSISRNLSPAQFLSLTLQSQNR